MAFEVFLLKRIVSSAGGRDCGNPTWAVKYLKEKQISFNRRKHWR